MGIKIEVKSKFEPCPEFSGRACCVDVTPLRTVETMYGVRELFRFVFEVDLDRPDGTRYCVWSKGFTPSYGKRSALRPFLKKILGHEMSDSDAAEFDMDSVVGKPFIITVVQEAADNGQVYSNIVAVKPDTGKDPLKPTGKFVREKDRKHEDQAKRLPQTGAAGAPKDADPATLKVHRGRYKGQELRDLDERQVLGLVEHLLPEILEQEKQSADDKRLVAALQAWEKKHNSKADTEDDDDLPM